MSKYIATRAIRGANFIVNEAEILRRIEENKQKPVKKSAWQKRLEDAQRQSGRKALKK